MLLIQGCGLELRTIKCTRYQNSVMQGVREAWYEKQEKGMLYFGGLNN